MSLSLATNVLSVEFYEYTPGLFLCRHKKQGNYGFCGYELNQSLLTTWKPEQKALLCGVKDVDYLLKELEEKHIEEDFIFVLWGDLINNDQPSTGPFGLRVQSIKWQDGAWRSKEISLGEIFGKNLLMPLKANKAMIEELFLSNSLQYHC